MTDASQRGSQGRGPAEPPAAVMGSLHRERRRGSPRQLLPDPEPRRRLFPLISVDDHVLEPPDIFTRRVPHRLRELAPRVVEVPDGQAWAWDNQVVPISSSNAAISWGPEDWFGGAISFGKVRPGVWRPDDRVRDMDLAGVDASLNFPSMCFGFAGQRLSTIADERAALACVRAYNDWMINEWTASAPRRFIPCQIPWFGDPVVAADLVRGNAKAGFKALSFSENPAALGYPSIHSGHWDPVFAACEETGTVVNLHVGSSSRVAQQSEDSPPDVTVILVGLNAIAATTDWLYSPVPHRFPDLRIVMSEGGIDWLPMLVARLRSQDDFRRATGGWRSPMDPLEVLFRTFRFSALWDFAAYRLPDVVPPANIMAEVDYPHADSTFPDAQAALEARMGSLPPEDLARITHRNAAELYRHSFT